MKDVPPYALCSFVPPDSANQVLAAEEEAGTLLADVSCPAIGADEDMALGIIESTSTMSSTIQLWPWVNQVRCSLQLDNRIADASHRRRCLSLLNSRSR